MEYNILQNIHRKVENLCFNPMVMIPTPVISLSAILRDPIGEKALGLQSAAAAKSLQSCPTLCDPIDGSPPGSPVPGILQARTLEWVAISFSNAGKWKVKVKLLSRVRLFMTSWTAAYTFSVSKESLWRLANCEGGSPWEFPYFWYFKLRRFPKLYSILITH